MTSKVDVCNQALANIRSQAINVFGESSVQGQYTELKYQLALEFVLSDAPWNFAKKQAVLSLTTDDLYDYLYAYQYPSDCLRINRVMPDGYRITQAESGYAFRPQYYEDPHLRVKPTIEYQVLNSSNNLVIGSNVADLWADYNICVDDPNKWPAQFLMAMGWYLAAEVAMPIIGGDNGRSQRSDALAAYQQIIDTATASNLNEQENGPPEDSDLILVRS